MWDVLSGDFDQNISIVKCFQNVVSNVQAGSIIVFHDSMKAKNNVLGALPMVMKELQSKGYDFKSLRELL